MTATRTRRILAPLARAGRAVRSAVRTVTTRPPWLTIAGLGAFAAAGWSVSTLAGLIVTGAAFLLLEWRITS